METLLTSIRLVALMCLARMAAAKHARRPRTGELTRLAGIALLVACTPAGSQPDGSTGSDAVLSISSTMCEDMKDHHVLNKGAPVGCERLKLVQFSYIGFDHQTYHGQIIVLDAVAEQVLQIFVTLRARSFPIAGAQLMNRYNGDDDASMGENNTSAFNVRRIAGGGAMSLHSYGVAIDINPVQNPFVRRSATGQKSKISVSPKAGADYTVRKPIRPGMAESIVDVFEDHGFAEWGGRWRNPIDYQHFQVRKKLAYQLVRLPAEQARATFERYVMRYNGCVQAASRKETARRLCANQ
jgi:hypothetical protein